VRTTSNENSLKSVGIAAEAKESDARLLARCAILLDADVHYVIYGLTAERLLRAYFRTLATDVLTTSNAYFIKKAGADFEEHEEVMQLLWNSIGIMHAERRTFATNHDFIGLGLQEMEEGDAICLVPSNETPLVLQQLTDDSWRFIRECYVYGVMDRKFLKNILQDSGTCV
jgi:hypothetical protein